MVSLYGIKTDLTNAGDLIKKIVDRVNLLDATLNNVEKIDFYSEAYFDADENCMWLIDVILDITGENKEHFRIRVDRKTVYQQPRYSYSDWKLQRDADRQKAEQVLQSMFDKWGCAIRPIGE